MVEERALAPHERAVLLRILEAAPIPQAQELRSQVDAIKVVGGLPTLLDLKVTTSAPAKSFSDGPVPVRAFVEGPSGAVDGEVLVWVTDGYLSGLEFAWVTDEAPSAIPLPDRIRIETK